MELEKGYKQTEIGLIPENWVVEELNALLKFGNGQDYKHLSKGIIPVYGTGGIMTFVDDFLYDGDSVGIGRKGTIDKPVFLSGKFWTVDTLFYTHSFVQTTPKFIYYKFLTIKWKDYNEASGVPSLNKNNLCKIKIPLPPLPEQQAIATILSDTDNFINALAQQLDKKRAIKQGAMQELLKPKEGWEVKTLGEIGEIATGTTPPTRDIDNYGIDFCFVSPADLGYSKYISKTEKNLSKKGFKISRKFPKNSILFTCIGSTIGKMGISSIELTSNQQINAIFPNIDFNTEYLYYQLCLIAKKIRMMASEQAVPMINKSEFSEILVSIPTITEQTRIATILSDMDLEAAQLEEKLAKYKVVKQGLMQQLLTGKIRVV